MPNPDNMKNLKPFVKGDPRINRGGRPKGVKNLATVVQQILADEKLIDKVVKNKPSYWEDLPNKNAANAIVIAMVIQAMQGEKGAAEWLRKAGFGDKLMHEFEDGLFQTTRLEVEIVKPKATNERDAESQLLDS